MNGFLKQGLALALLTVIISKIEQDWDPAVWKERKYFDDAVSWTMGTQQ